MAGVAAGAVVLARPVASAAEGVGQAFRISQLWRGIPALYSLLKAQLWPPRKQNMRLLLGIFAGAVAALLWAIKPRWGRDELAEEFGRKKTSIRQLEYVLFTEQQRLAKVGIAKAIRSGDRVQLHAAVTAGRDLGVELEAGLKALFEASADAGREARKQLVEMAADDGSGTLEALLGVAAARSDQEGLELILECAPLAGKS